MSQNAGIYFCLIFFCFVFDCHAYEIHALPGRSAPKSSAILNLVFCPLNYRSHDDFLRDAGLVTRKLHKTKPFDEFLQAIGSYYVVASKREESVFFKKARDFPPLKVRQDFLDDLSKRLGSDYKLVIMDASGPRFCAELSLKNKTSLIILGKAGPKESLGKFFLHELGHSLGLRDESFEVHAKDSPAGYPNCATRREEAQKWWGDMTGKDKRVDYVNGCCGNKNYFRPTIASLMNDANKAEDFGPVNERYLRNTLAETK